MIDTEVQEAAVSKERHLRAEILFNYQAVRYQTDH
jgi:hypothetical protein